MHLLHLLLCLALVCVQGAVIGPEARNAITTANGHQQQLSASSTGVLDSVLRGNGKSRQSRCVRCYEDRYYGSSSGDRYGGYSSRTAEDPRSSWYYSNDRYDDRGGSVRDRDYDRYYGRDDRYSPRTYDRYEGRGYDDYYRRGASYDRGSGYTSGYGSGYGYGNAGYDSRDRYYGDRDSSRDRYYDRSRSGSNYDRYDPYDRYYSRYDFRNYRPWDETYRGQSGFDNSGRGYYFAGDDDDTRTNAQPFYDRERAQSLSPASPCGHLINNCPYGDRGTKVSTNAIGSDGYRGGHTSVMGDMAKPNGQGSWTYLGEQDKQSSRGGSNGNTNSMGNNNAAGSASAVASGNAMGGGRDREHEPQSSSYGGRPRPLGGSYLFDRDSNAVPEGTSEAANTNGDGGGVGSAHMPAAAAQTAANPNESQDNAKDKAKQ